MFANLKVNGVIAILLFLGGVSAWSGDLSWLGLPYQSTDHFDSLRQDLTVPEPCRRVTLENFAQELEILTVGIKGAVNQGFTHEYPISRQEANFLWGVLKNDSPSPSQRRQIDNSPALQREYAVVKEANKLRGFSFASEGEILEILVQEQMHQVYPRDQFFVTGSVAYHEKGGAQYIGELDLMVGDRDTCEIFAVGEVKLGLRSLSTARRQMERFSRFLLGHDRERELLPFNLVGFAQGVGSGIWLSKRVSEKSWSRLSHPAIFPLKTRVDNIGCLRARKLIFES